MNQRRSKWCEGGEGHTESFLRGKHDSEEAELEELEMAANPDVKCHNGLLSMLFFSCISLLLQLVIQMRALQRKTVASSMYKLGIECFNLLHESHHLSGVSCVREFGRKRNLQKVELSCDFNEREPLPMCVGMRDEEKSMANTSLKREVL